MEVYCKICAREYNGFKFCPECGTKLEDVSRLDSKYKNSYGLWLVESEESLDDYRKVIGVFRGHLDDIALSLSTTHKCVLVFKALGDIVDIGIIDIPRPCSVTVKLGESSGLRCVSSDIILNQMQYILRDRETSVSTSRMYGAVRLIKLKR